MVAIYARQSVFKADSLSIDAQIELCKNYANEEAEVYKDAGFSGKNTDRPEFTRMMEDIKAGKISRVICYKIDRISRSIADFGRIWDELSRYNVQFVSVTEQFDTGTPIGRAMLYIAMVFAQLERETIAQRVTDNYYKRLREGAWPGGPAPFGYDRRREQIGGKLATVIVPNQDMPHVRYLFEEYAKGGTSLGRLAAEMRERMTGAYDWSNVRVRRILTNPVYAEADADLYAFYSSLGAQIVNPVQEFDGNHSALLIGYRNAETRKRRNITEQQLFITSASGIVSSDVFIKVQRQLSKNKQIKNTAGSKYSWLSGLLKCRACGYSLKVQHDTRCGKSYFYCSNKYGSRHTCTERHAERPEHVEEYIATLATKRIADLISTGGATSDPAQAAELNALKLQLIEIQNKQRNLVDAIAAGGAAAVRLLTPELERLDTESSAISRQINLINASRPEWIPSAFIDFQSLGFEEKRAAINKMVDKIYVLNDDIEIVWK